MTRQINPSTSSLSLAGPAGPSNPIHREAARTATSVLCKEMLRPSQSASLGLRYSKDECRMRALALLERVSGKGDAYTNGSTTQLGSGANMSGEEGRARAKTVHRGYAG